jgi:hypothetical protein
MSTASRYCGSVGGTCGGVDTRHSSPGATGRPRRHYDLRAERQLVSARGAEGKRRPLATNAAPPRKRAGAPGKGGALSPARALSPVRRAHCAVFPIGLRGRPRRHSLPPTPSGARGETRGRRPP